jgi:BASS family bile acid:Na+ symporter
MQPAKLIAAIMLVTLTFGAGLEVNRAHLAAVWKNWSLLTRAILANFVLVPIFGVVLVRAFHVDIDIATGILLMAIAPGVPFILLGVRKKGGSLALAVTMAVFFPLLSTVTVPITASLVLPSVMRAPLPVGQFIVTLVLFQLVPLVVGSVIAKRLPKLAPRLEKPVKAVFFLTLFVLLVVLVPRLVHDVGSVYGSNGMIAMLCIVVLSIASGWLLGGPDSRERRVLGIGTALRNIGLCALVATVSFGDDSRVVAAVLVYLLIQFFITAIVGMYFTRTVKAQAP